MNYDKVAKNRSEQCQIFRDISLTTDAATAALTSFDRAMIVYKFAIGRISKGRSRREQSSIWCGVWRKGIAQSTGSDNCPRFGRASSIREVFMIVFMLN